jgi:kinetochore protein Spc7/SPC105
VTSGSTKFSLTNQRSSTRLDSRVLVVIVIHRVTPAACLPLFAILSSPPPTHADAATMIEPGDKENQSPLRFASGKSPSPHKSRRQDMTQSSVKSILPSKQDEAKRREARRKSLANRRVSFAPEATLHTWDVIEYMRDATASSTASGPSKPQQDAESDPPSTPPSQADDDSDLPESPEHQRDVHQTKRRRSSAIPPMNFNDLDEYSSSPVSGSSTAEASSDVEENVESDDDHGDSTAMSLDQTLLSQESVESTGSSARLDAALQQAAHQAGTRGINYDEHGDMSMEMAGDEITNAFKPWAQGQHFATAEQGTDNPFDSVFQPGPQPGDEEDEGEDDMSMDMTRAVGGILPQLVANKRQDQYANSNEKQQQQDEEEEDDGDMTMDMTRPMGAIWTAKAQEEEDNKDMTMDMTRPVGRILQTYQQSPERTVSFGDETMDLTLAVGRIHQWNPQAQPPRSALKRRFETFATEDVASPSLKKPVISASPLGKKPVFEEPTRRTVAQARDGKRRRSSSSRLSLGDATMDLTVAVGTIQQSPVKKQDRRLSSRSRRSSAASSVMDEQTMDFTMAVGGIKHHQEQQPKSPREASIIEEDDLEVNEDMSMDFTAVVGNILKQHAAVEITRPTTPHKSPSPVRSEVPTTPKDQERFKEPRELTAKKLSTPLFVPTSAAKESPASRRSSARKSALRESTKSPAVLSPAVLASPHKSPASARVSSSAQKPPPSVQKTPASATKSPHLTNQVSESARHTPLAQTSPGSAKKNASSVHKSPASAARTPTKSPATKSSSRKSSVATRRSARNSIAADQSQQKDIVSTPSKTLRVEEPQDQVQTNQSAHRDTSTIHDEPMSDIDYPVLPHAQESTATATSQMVESTTTPQITKTPSAQSPVTHHPAISMAGSPLRSPAHATPRQIDLEELNPTSPSLEKQLRTSPVKFAATPEQRQPNREEPRSTFANSIKFLSTPSKETGTSPLKRLRGLTPKKSPAKRAMTPKSMATPKSSTPFIVQTQNAPAILDLEAAKSIFAVPKTGLPARKIELNDFLNIAGVKFMDLTASKRRHTQAPAPSQSFGADAEDQTIDLEGAVVAGACTMPMLELFQHACRELKTYISEGKTILKTLEAVVYDDTPPFFKAYMDAGSEYKAQLDGNMRDAKTNARMSSKQAWYDWRSKLLDGLADGLNRIKDNLDADAEILGQKQQALDSVLPDLLQQYEELLKQAEQLEEVAAASSEEEREELRAARARLVEVDEQIEERKRMLASLQRDIDEQDNLAQAYEEGKAESLAAIQEAERIAESCRGFTIDQVQALKGIEPKLTVLFSFLTNVSK